jgi:hypothetical protein
MIGCWFGADLGVIFAALASVYLSLIFFPKFLLNLKQRF